MNNRKIDKKVNKQVAIDAGLHRILKIRATEAGQSIKEFLEGYLAEILEVKSGKDKY